jgi:hypothetical protein
LNQGPLDLQSNALPTELFRPTRELVQTPSLDFSIVGLEILVINI